MKKDKFNKFVEKLYQKIFKKYEMFDSICISLILCLLVESINFLFEKYFGNKFLIRMTVLLLFSLMSLMLLLNRIFYQKKMPLIREGIALLLMFFLPLLLLLYIIC